MRNYLEEEEGVYLVIPESANVVYRYRNSNCLLHSLKLPAIKWLNSIAEEWYVDGSHHRDDGPAIITSSGTELWFRQGKGYSPTAHERMMWELIKSKERHSPDLK